MTTANGYLRLALFELLQPTGSATKFDDEKKHSLERITSFIASVYAPMFLRVHVKPRAPDGPENAIFLRDLLISYEQHDQNLVNEAIKRSFLAHATTWLNPTNVALSIHSDNPPFPPSAIQSVEQSLPLEVNTQQMLWNRTPLRSFFSAKSKFAPCLVWRDPQFWRSIDNHNRTCERFIGKMSMVLEEGRVRKGRGGVNMAEYNSRIRGYVVNDR